ncbi:DUF1328 domain-containing protein [Palleronia sp. LCG004]|uniref:DUF1328 domain-containing protein n=1 Tax=Palleronia sp. LCG004 TaxID=3079304 RepID=UPI002943A5D5|nr:DUF1328 family protein [Palleronia sp. LCG004]WOI56003.1 DUF1328 family protein [Palleronia sp. LCG004]
MLYWAFGFFVVALTAGLLGFGGLASAFAGVAQIAFFVSLLLSLIMVAIEMTNER